MKLGLRLRWAYRYVKATNPARLRAAWTAVLAEAALAGVAIPADLNRWVTFTLALAGILVPLLQGEATRASVYSPASYAAGVEQAKVTPPPM